MDEVGGGSQISTSSDLAHVFDKILAYLYTDTTDTTLDSRNQKKKMFSCQQYIGCEHEKKGRMHWCQRSGVDS